MWIFRWIFWVLVFLLLIYFTIQNTQETVRVEFMKWQSPELPLWVVMYVAFGVGILVWLFGSIFKVLQLKAEVRKVRKENKSLKDELDNLRNIPIEEEPELDDIEGEGEVDV